MSKELLSKNTAGVLSAVVKQPHWEKDQLQEGLNKVLLQARESAGSEEEYLELLLKNATFQYANTNAAISFLTQCIEDEKFFPLEIFQSLMVSVPKQVNDSNFLAEHMPRFKEIVYKGSTTEEQVIHAEKNFSHTKIANDMLVEFIGTFLQPDNRNFMANFLEYSSRVVVDTVMHYCQDYSNQILDELNSIKSTT